MGQCSNNIMSEELFEILENVEKQRGINHFLFIFSPCMFKWTSYALMLPSGSAISLKHTGH